MPSHIAPSTFAQVSSTHSAASPEWAVALKGLTKTYPSRGNAPAKQALKGIDLTIPRGSFFGLLGPNGAGKSTMINILAGLVIKTGGEARIWDYNIDERPRQSRAAIGVVPQELILDPFFTPREILDLQAGLYGVPRSERRTLERLDAVGLADKAEYIMNIIKDLPFGQILKLEL